MKSISYKSILIIHLIILYDIIFIFYSTVCIYIYIINTVLSPLNSFAWPPHRLYWPIGGHSRVDPRAGAVGAATERTGRQLVGGPEFRGAQMALEPSEIHLYPKCLSLLAVYWLYF